MRCQHCQVRVDELRECRNCSTDVCEACSLPGTMEATERDRPGYEGEPAYAVRTETVLCVDCPPESMAAIQRELK